MSAAIVAVDSSALIRRYLADRDRPLVVATMAETPAWSASALARTETQLALQALAPDPITLAELWRTLHDEWAAFHVVPVDDRCLGRAAELGARFRLRIVDAIHLAAADRLPRPARYLTFDRRQLPAAGALGLDVVSPLAAETP